MELIIGSPHVGTHFDGLAHIQSFGKTHGGHAARDVFDDFGWRANGLEEAAPVVCRGILLDVAAAKGGACLPDGYEITPDDDACFISQATYLRPGDAVLVRTGWFAAHYERDPDAYFASAAGPASTPRSGCTSAGCGCSVPTPRARR